MYKPVLNIRETEVAIKFLRTYFENAISKELNLTRISAPLFVEPQTGLNDNLNEIERRVNFDLGNYHGVELEIVQSLAKWKRHALNRYGFNVGEGIYTNMNAIRRDEILDSLHSIYVDQWDWEKIIDPEKRNVETLKATVNQIYSVLLDVENEIAKNYSYIQKILPNTIKFITTQELEDLFPNEKASTRETLAAKEYGAIFLMKIGGKLKSGEIHDGRAADYDDWNLNGDIIIYYDELQRGFELSSMGIRVNPETMKSQLKERNMEHKLELPFHKAIINGELPQTIGGGIGQSRLCMYFLRKHHIGEVQASYWDDNKDYYL